MIFGRDGCTALGALMALLLSGRIDAFTVCPATKSAARCRRTTGLPSSTALAGSKWVHASSYTRSAAGPRRPTGLSMADVEAPEVTVETLSNREFQVRTWVAAVHVMTTERSKRSASCVALSTSHLRSLRVSLHEPIPQ